MFVNTEPAMSVAAASPRERRKQALQTRILEAAYQLFAEFGIAETSIESICQAAGVARRTFYGYFPNKQAVLQRLCRERLFGALAQLSRDDECTPTTAGRLRALLMHMAATMENYRAIDRELLISTADWFDSREQHREASDSLRAQLLHILRRGQARGEVRNDVGVELLADMVVGTINMRTLRWAQDETYPIGEKLAEAAGLLEDVVGRS